MQRAPSRKPHPLFQPFVLLTTLLAAWLIPEPVAVGASIGIDLSDSVDEEVVVVGPGEEVLGQSDSGPAAGILTGSGDDAITNEGEVRGVSAVEGDAEAVGIDTATGEDRVTNRGEVEADAEAWLLFGSAAAESVGIAGGTEDDTIENPDADAPEDTDASIAAEATATSGDGDLDVSAEGGAVADASTEALATAAGIRGEAGADQIGGGGGVGAAAGAIAGSGNISVGAGAGSLATAAARATAGAVGLEGGEGDDRITPGGPVTVESTASAGSGNLVADLEGGTEGDVSTRAEAAATGIAGGEGTDAVTSSGNLLVEATAGSGGGNVAGNLHGDSQAEADSKAEASATGIAGGEGGDTITSVGESLTARADADSGAGSIAAGTGQVNADVSSQARASARGIDGGAGEDDIENRAAILAEATATSGAGSVGVAVPAEGEPPPPPPEGGESREASGDASSTADATAIGIDGGAGSDGVTSTGPSITAIAGADSVAGAIAVGVGGNASGGASSGAGATAKGITSAEGVEAITNAAAILAEAGALSVAGSIAVSAPAEGGGEAPEEEEGNTAAGGADSTATASAAGLEGGSVTTTGGVGAGADADAVGGSIAGNAEGAAEGGANATAEAAALGIGGSAAEDTITIEAAAEKVEATAAADAIAGSIAGGVAGDASGAATSTASATAKAVDSGEGDDSIENHAEILADAGALSVAGAVGVGLPKDGDNGGSGGEEEGEPTTATGEAESRAVAVAAGLEAGAVTNTGAILAHAQAESVGGSIAANLDGDAEGNAASGADASATGIGGSGAGEILDSRSGAIQAEAFATSGAATVAAGAGGTAAGDASSTAKAGARGIDAGAGGDTIRGDSTIVAKADAGSGAGSLAAGTPSLGDDEGAAATTSAAVAAELPALEDYVASVKGDASSEADAEAVGIAGGDGDDSVDTTGPIVAEADATSVAVALSTNVAKVKQDVGAALTLADATSTADARAIGIDGGAGDDELAHTGDIAADADAVTVAISGGLGVTVGEGKLAGGATLGDATTTAGAAATGLFGGAGDDELSHSGAIDARADSDATAVAATLQVTQFQEASGVSAALAKSSTAAAATAVGMDAGAAGDPPGGEKPELVIEGRIGSDATAEATGVSVSLDVTLDKDGGSLSLGASMAKGTVESEATADGIRGSDAAEKIENRGEALLHADADATSVSVAASVGVSAGKKASLNAGVALADATADAEAKATGVTGGAGDDEIANTGRIATTTSGEPADGPFEIVDPDVEGEDKSIVVEGCDDDSAGVCASSGATSVAVRAQVVKDGATLGASLSDTTSTATAAAAGIDGGAGMDVVTNAGEIALEQVRADAHATSVSVTVSGAAKGLAAGAALSRSAAIAEADATGIEGGTDRDEITDEGSISTDVAARADSLSVSGSLGVVSTGASLEASLSDSRAESTATTTGISGGAGDDLLTQTDEGEIDLKAHAEAETVAVSVTVAGAATGLAAGASLANSGGSAGAEATGIDGGSGVDGITNHGAIGADASADADATSVAVALTVAAKGVSLGGGLSDSTSTADVQASGVEGGSGDDVIVNSGAIRVGTAPDSQEPDQWTEAMAESDATSVTVSVAGTAKGVAGGAALSDSTTRAVTHSRGIGGGSGDDAITVAAEEGEPGDIRVYATSAADATSNSVNVSITGAGVAAGAALARANAEAEAGAVGIAGGAREDEADETAEAAEEESDDDRITNESLIEATAKANSSSRSVGISIGASAGGIGLGAALTDGSSEATAQAAAIDGGAGADWIANRNEVKATSLAGSESNVLSVGVGISVSGAASGSGLSRTESTARAVASGIEGGSGADQIDNAADVTARAEADAGADATSVSISGTMSGVAAGLAVADSSAEASSRATGIGSDDYGAQDPEAEGGASEAYILSDASVDPDGQLSFEAPAHTIDADATSVAESKSVTVAVGVAGPGPNIGLAAGASVTDSSATAKANAAGIHGGLEGETIASGSEIEATTVAEATAGSSSIGVGVVGGIGLAGGASAAEAAAEATADSTGIHGGGGADRIVNGGSIDAKATADAKASGDATQVSVAIAGAAGGAAISDASATGTATATGIAGGGGDDEVETGLVGNAEENSLTVDSTSTATAGSNSLSVSVAVIGAAASAAQADAAAAAIALSTGIDGGSGGDTIRAGAMTVTSSSEAKGKSEAKSISPVPIGVGLQLAGADGSATSDATSRGISGGSGDDTITATGSIDVTATSDGNATAVSEARGLSIIGASIGHSASDSSTSVESASTGIGGGDGVDTIDIDNAGALVVTSTSNADAKARSKADSYAFIGGAKASSASDTSASLVSKAMGVDGGADGDVVTNMGSVEVLADSDGTVVTESNSSAKVSFIGSASAKSAADASAHSTAEATGIAGGLGDDRIDNEGWTDVDARSHLDVTVTSVSVARATFGSTSATAGSDATAVTRAEATGIAGGGNDDVIENEGALHSRARATMVLRQSTVALADETEAHAANDVTSDVNATGISGGAGNDEIDVRELVFVEAVGDLDVRSLTVSGNGSSTSDARTLSIAHAAGLDGGTGDDAVTNEDLVFVTTTPHIKTGSRNYGKDLQGRTGIAMDVDARGISGGDGDDQLVNEGEVVVLVGRPETVETLAEDLPSGSLSFVDETLAGTDEEDLVGRWLHFKPEEGPGFLGRVAEFDSGSGEVTLVDPTEVELLAGSEYTVYDFGEAPADIEAVSINVGGRVFVDASRSAAVRAVGIDAGPGADGIENPGSVQVKASNQIQVGDYNVGKVEANLSTASVVSADGISAGPPDESGAVFGSVTVTNQHEIDVEALSSVDADGGFTWEWASGGSTEIEGRAEASSGGVRGGDLDDSVTNLGDVRALSIADVQATKGTNAFLDLGGSQSLVFKSESSSVGAALGAGNDAVTNAEGGEVDVEARAEGAVDSVRVALVPVRFFGLWLRQPAANQARQRATADASGLELGEGDDTALNEGRLEVDSRAFATTEARVEDSVIAEALAKAAASGIHGRDGENDVRNLDTVEVEGQAVAVAGAKGSEVVGGDDVSQVTEVLPADEDEPVSFVDADTIGASASVVGKRIAFAGFVTTVTGFDPGSGTFTLGDLPDGASISAGDAYTLSLVTEAAAAGSLGFVDGSRAGRGEDPADFVGQWIRFDALPGFVTRVDGFDPSTGRFTLEAPLPLGPGLSVNDVYTLSDSREGGAGAIADALVQGIRLVDGDATVANEGVITARAFARAQATLSAQVVEEVGAQATASGRGIQTGGGEDEIVNAGVVSVESTVDATTRTNGSSDEANTTRVSEAYGVATGTGDDTVTNEGTVLAVARTAQEAGERVAVGIETGPEELGAAGDADPQLAAEPPVAASDDDHVVNRGEGLVAAVTALGASNALEPIVDPADVEEAIATGTPAVAIRTGAGDDRVELRDHSRVVGRVELGRDDDWLVLADEATLEGSVDAGVGEDAVQIEGTGSFHLEGLEEAEHVLVDQGRLAVGSDLSLGAGAGAAPAGGIPFAAGAPALPAAAPAEALPSFRTELYHGGFGMLVVDGEAQLLGGSSAEVVARPRIYTDAIYGVLGAETIVNDFSQVILPPDSALVSFDYDYLRGADTDFFRVLVEVEPFETVARNRLQRAVARYLERVAPIADDDLVQWIGTFQLLLPDADFDTAFTSLSPDQYDATTLSGIDTQRQYLRGLSRRMDSVRAWHQLGIEPTKALASLGLGMTGSSSTMLALAGVIQPVSLAGEEEASYNVWIDGLGQLGDQDGADGFSGFDYAMGGGSLGIDRVFGRRFVGGVNAGYSYTDVDVDKGRGAADIHAIQGSLYGTWFTERGFVEGTLGYARQRYDNRRKVVVGPLVATARGEHDANVFGVQLGGGYRFELGGFGLRPFGTLSYLLLDEEGFTEEGAPGANLNMDPRTMHSLVSELGLRVARGFEPEAGTFVPYLSAAWKHDFAIDDRTLVAGFTGAPGTSFPLDGRTLDRNGALVGAGLLFFRGRYSASLEYLGEFRGDYTANGLFARFGVAF